LPFEQDGSRATAPDCPDSHEMLQNIGSNYLKGAVFGFAAASLWASWSVITRPAVTTNLGAGDIAALRYGVAGLLLAPVLVRRGLARDRLGWLGLAVIIAGLGAPYALAAAGGLDFAPARDQGALNPGCMPLFVALIAAAVLGEKLSTTRKLGLSVMLVGAIIIVGWHGWSAARSTSRSFGDALFLFAAFLSACFAVAMRQAQLDPLHAAALVSTGSLVIYLPIYLALYGTRLAQLPLAEITAQAIFQGVLVTIVSLLLYGRAVAILGASGGAAFGALAPALSALFAIPLLGEWPSKTDWVSIVLISAGVQLASGGPLPNWKARERRRA
jgi:drug/metabolite transporter (DMT)-like permease